MAEKNKFPVGNARGEDELMRKRVGLTTRHRRGFGRDRSENRRDYLLALRRVENPRRRWSMQEVKTLLDGSDNRR